MDRLIVLVVLVAVGIAVAKLRSDAAKGRKEVMARLAQERELRGGVDYSPTAELFREVGVRHDPDAPLPRDLPDVTGLPDLAPPTTEPVAHLAPPDDHEPAAEAAETTTPDETPVRSGLTPSAPVPTEPVLAEPQISEPVLTEPLISEPVLTEPLIGEPAEREPEPVASDLRSLFRGIAMPAGLRPLGPLAPEGADFVTTAAPTEVHAGLDAEFARLACSARWVEPTVAQAERNGMRGLVTIYPNPTAAIDLDGRPLFPEVSPGEVVVRMLAL